MDNQQKPKELENWLPLESNTKVLNNYLSVLGVNTELVKFYDIISFDSESLLYIPQPILGALFVYPDSKFINNYFFEKGEEMFKTQPPADLYYMKQIAENACGTIGILHNMLNVMQDHPHVLEEGSFIQQFYSDTYTMNPEQRAEYLNSCKKAVIKKEGQNKSLLEAHQDAVKEGAPEDVNLKANHHFVTFVWSSKGQVVELDGRKKGPIVYNECPRELFMESVFQICLQHYVTQDKAEVGFNLMALSLDEELAQLLTNKEFQ